MFRKLRTRSLAFTVICPMQVQPHEVSKKMRKILTSKRKLSNKKKNEAILGKSCEFKLIILEEETKDTERTYKGQIQSKEAFPNTFPPYFEEEDLIIQFKKLGRRKRLQPLSELECKPTPPESDLDVSLPCKRAHTLSKESQCSIDILVKTDIATQTEEQQSSGINLQNTTGTQTIVQDDNLSSPISTDRFGYNDVSKQSKITTVHTTPLATQDEIFLLNKPWKNSNWVSLDCEMFPYILDGENKETPHVIRLSIIHEHGYCVFDRIMDPGKDTVFQKKRIGQTRYVEQFVHKISRNIVSNSPAPSTFREEVKLLLNDQIIIGHSLALSVTGFEFKAQKKVDIAKIEEYRMNGQAVSLEKLCQRYSIEKPNHDSVRYFL